MIYLNLNFYKMMLLVMMCVFSSTSLFAKSWQSVGWFDITEAETSCVATAEYNFDGRSDVKLALLVGEDGYPILMINSLDWSAKDGVEYPGITYSLNGFTYSDVKNKDGKFLLVTNGNTFDGIYKGFIRIFTANFLDDFASGSSLLIENGDSVITHIKLFSSSDAVAKLRECSAYLKRKNDAQRKQEAEWDYISKDPFAEPTTKTNPNLLATPKSNIGLWSNISDYPSSALNENREGVVGFKLTIDTDGNVTKCDITESSGHSDLDQATCVNIAKRAKFNPATGHDGKPIIGQFISRAIWQLPAD